MNNQIPKNAPGHSREAKEGWQKVKLGEVVNVYGGGTPSTQNQSYWNGDIPWLTPAELTNTESRSTAGTASYITPAGLQNSSARVMPENSILLTSRATIGNATINTVPMATNQGFINIEPKEVDRDFFYYWLKDKRKYLNQIAIGSTFPELSKSVFKEIETIVPEEKKEQEKIGEFLSAFDDKIEVNNKIAKTLEEMAQALFKEWFVKFRFSGYEKAELVDSELGKIPKEWEVKVLSDYLDLRGGLSYKAEFLTSDRGKGLPLITMGSVSQTSRLNFDGLKYYKGNYSERNLLRPGDIAIATRDVTQERTILASPVIIPSILPKSILATNMYLIENKGKVPQLFLFHQFKTRQFRERILGSAKGSNILMLTRDSVLDFKFVLPTKELIDRFDNLAIIISQKIENLTTENQKLTALRDLLLPKLMKGEIRIN